MGGVPEMNDRNKQAERVSNHSASMTIKAATDVGPVRDDALGNESHPVMGLAD